MLGETQLQVRQSGELMMKPAFLYFILIKHKEESVNALCTACLSCGAPHCSLRAAMHREWRQMGRCEWANGLLACSVKTNMAATFQYRFLNRLVLSDLQGSKCLLYCFNYFNYSARTHKSFLCNIHYAYVAVPLLCMNSLNK